MIEELINPKYYRMKSKIPIKKKCEWCGKDFIAYKVTTRFCSKQCNSYAYKDMLRNQRIKLVQDSIIVQEQNETDSKEYLSPKETAMLLSVDRVTNVLVFFLFTLSPYFAMIL